MNGTPFDEVMDGLVHGKDRAQELLRGAIRMLTEKMEDDFPGEPIDQVTLAARTAISSIGGATFQAERSGGGAASIEVTRPPQVTLVEGNTETRFAELLGRVGLLEASLNQLRETIDPQQQREVGIGHNQGPDLAPVPIEELADVDDLIALLKEQRPEPPSDPTPLVEQSHW
jgi:hypothetical protein